MFATRIYPTILAFCFIHLLIQINCCASLRCRSDEGPSDGELKRVVRTCMRKFGESVFMQNSQQQQQQQLMQTQQQQQAGRFAGQAAGNQRGNKNSYGHYPDYNDSDDSEERSKGQDDYRGYYQQRRNYQPNYYSDSNSNSNSNSNNNNNGYGNGYSYVNTAEHNDNEGYGNQRNRHRSNNQNKTNGGENYNWQQTTTNQRHSPSSRGGGNQNSNSNSNNYNHNNGNNNNANHNRSRNNNNNQNNSNNNNNGNTNSNGNKNSSADSACIVYCFFEEMNMLNGNSYPDRHKVFYILTKDLRDRELRSFYSDTIQECFRFLESQRRRDKCQFSRDLINCMTEYAKANCDDWNEFSMMFN